jgi:dolichol-phosphate mannosyltransferase
MLSIVIPVFNEAESLEALAAELRAVAEQNGYTLDVVFVDDGSRDASWDIISRLAASDPHIRGIRFRRNFGKAAALSAGFSAARGELVMTLDADLQDDPHEIPRFLAQMETGLDVVSGWKKVRHDPWHKVGPSRVFNWMVSRLTGVVLHDHNCGMKCYRRQVFDEVQLYGELHRFVPVLAAARGYRVGELVINHRARQHGHSKYGVSRILKGFLDLLTVKFLTGFGQRPQHVLGAAGLASFLLGALGLGLLPLHQRPAVLYAVGLLLLGGQLMSIGFLAELMIAYQRPQERSYSISQRTPVSSDQDRPRP